MTEEIFWIISTINFIMVIVLTIVNISITKKLSIKSDNVNIKTGIDISVHKDLMLFISDFLISISEDRVKLLDGEEYDDNILITIKNNSSYMRNCYIKLDLFLCYSFTNNEDLRKLLRGIYEKYYEVFGALMDALYYDKKYQKMKSMEEQIASIDKVNAKYNKYYSILNDTRIDEEFFEQLDRFVKCEIDYIKGNDEKK